VHSACDRGTRLELYRGCSQLRRQMQRTVIVHDGEARTSATVVRSCSSKLPDCRTCRMPDPDMDSGYLWSRLDALQRVGKTWAERDSHFRGGCIQKAFGDGRSSMCVAVRPTSTWAQSIAIRVLFAGRCRVLCHEQVELLSLGAL